MAKSVSVKWQIANQTRRFTAKTETDGNLYQNLMSIACSLVDRSDFELYWIDEDQESIVIKSEAELQEAIKFSDGKLLRLTSDSTTTTTPHSPIGAVAAKAPTAPVAPCVPTQTMDPAQATLPNGELLNVPHHGVLCDLCNQQVVGCRFKCLICFDFDLCSKCHDSGHHVEHAMLRIYHPRITVVPWGARIRKRCGPNIHHRDRTREKWQKHYSNIKEVGNAVASALTSLGISTTYEVRNPTPNNESTTPEAPPQCDERILKKSKEMTSETETPIVGQSTLYDIMNPDQNGVTFGVTLQPDHPPIIEVFEGNHDEIENDARTTLMDDDSHSYQTDSDISEWDCVTDESNRGSPQERAVATAPLLPATENVDADPSAKAREEAKKIINLLAAQNGLKLQNHSPQCVAMRQHQLVNLANDNSAPAQQDSLSSNDSHVYPVLSPTTEPLIQVTSIPTTSTPDSNSELGGISARVLSASRALTSAVLQHTQIPIEFLRNPPKTTRASETSQVPSEASQIPTQATQIPPLSSQIPPLSSQLPPLSSQIPSQTSQIPPQISQVAPQNSPAFANLSLAELNAAISAAPRAENTVMNDMSCFVMETLESMGFLKEDIIRAFNAGHVDVVDCINYLTRSS